MKKILLLLFCASAYSLSCNNDDDGVPFSESGSGTVMADIDGNAWASDDNNPAGGPGAVGVLNTPLNVRIDAYAKDGSYIGINVVSSSAIGNQKYTAAAGEFTGTYKDDYSNSEAFSTVGAGGLGEITFSTVNSNKLKGTFSFEGENPTMGKKNVTNGSFDIDI